MNFKHNIIQSIPLFGDLTKEEVEKIAEISVLRSYPKNTIIFEEGQKCETVYYIQSGFIKVIKGNEQLICLLPKGELFPHVGFLQPAKYPGTAHAVTDCQLLSISIEGFKQLLDSNPRITKSMMRLMDQWLLHMQNRLHGAISGDVCRKVIQFLLQLVEEYGISKENAAYVPIPLTNQDVASMLGLSRESVNRVLNQLKKEQLLEIKRKHITICNVEALKKYPSQTDVHKK